MSPPSDIQAKALNGISLVCSFFRFCARPIVLTLQKWLLLDGLPSPLFRYGGVSTLALGLDILVFRMLINALGVPIASVIGYSIGLVLHFVLSRRFVFDCSRSEKPQIRLFGEFAVSGLIGICITWIITSVATNVFGLGPMISKGLAIGPTFIAVFLLRRTFVFTVN